MRITYHKDGSYSLTGLTRDDINTLSFACLSAESWYLSPDRRWQSGNDDAWNREHAADVSRLERALRRAADARQPGHMVVTSRPFGAPRGTESYAVESRRGMMTYREHYDAEDAREAKRAAAAAETAGADR